MSNKNKKHPRAINTIEFDSQRDMRIPLDVKPGRNLMPETDACNEKDVYLPTIEEKLDRMESQANDSIYYAKETLAKVERIRTQLKKNPALSDIYTLLKF